MEELKMASKARTTASLAISIALVTLGTMAIRISIPATSGYMNLGDSMIFVSATILGRRYGLIAGGLGSALADILGGFPAWAPWTLVIKGVEGYVAGTLGDANAGLAIGSPTIKTIAASTVAGIWMIAGYFIASSVLYSPAGALAELPFNLVQAAGSVAIAAVLTPAVLRVVRPR